MIAFSFRFLASEGLNTGGILANGENMSRRRLRMVKMVNDYDLKSCIYAPNLCSPLTGSNVFLFVFTHSIKETSSNDKFKLLNKLSILRTLPGFDLISFRFPSSAMKGYWNWENLSFLF
jgi:hypothetical protein